MIRVQIRFCVSLYFAITILKITYTLLVDHSLHAITVWIWWLPTYTYTRIGKIRRTSQSCCTQVQDYWMWNATDDSKNKLCISYKAEPWSLPEQCLTSVDPSWLNVPSIVMTRLTPTNWSIKLWNPVTLVHGPMSCWPCKLTICLIWWAPHPLPYEMLLTRWVNSKHSFMHSWHLFLVLFCAVWSKNPRKQGKVLYFGPLWGRFFSVRNSTNERFSLCSICFQFWLIQPTTLKVLMKSMSIVLSEVKAIHHTTVNLHLWIQPLQILWNWVIYNHKFSVNSFTWNLQTKFICTDHTMLRKLW